MAETKIVYEVTIKINDSTIVVKQSSKTRIDKVLTDIRLEIKKEYPNDKMHIINVKHFL